MTTGLPIHSKYFFWAGDLFVFVQSIGYWQVFAPIVYEYEDQLWKKHIAPWNYEYVLYAPFKEKLFQIDPKAIKKPRKDQLHWWPVVCCYDPGA